MYGSLLSVLLMGMVPVWGLTDGGHAGVKKMTVAAPALYAGSGTGFAVLGRRLSASGIIITALDSGQTLFERSADTARPMASLTKLMTALLITENHDLSEWVTVPADIEDVAGTVAHLPAGDQLTVGDLLSALLIDSANDAAVTLARFHSGSLSAFVEHMNARARSLGMKSTVYANPTGLDAPAQKTSPRELAWLTMYTLRIPAIAERMSMRGARLTTRKGQSLSLTHTHALLHADTAVKAGKTGTTDAAGECLLSIVNADRRQYAVVLLRSADRYADMRLVLDTLTH